MSRKQIGKCLVSWMLAASLVVSGSSFAALAEEAPAAEEAVVEAIPAEEASAAVEAVPEETAPAAVEAAPEEEALVVEAVPEEEIPAVEAVPEEEAPAAEAVPEEEAPAAEAVPEEEIPAAEAAPEEAAPVEEELIFGEDEVILGEEPMAADLAKEAADQTMETENISLDSANSGSEYEVRLKTEDDIDIPLGAEICVTDYVESISYYDEELNFITIPVADLAKNNFRLCFMSEEEDEDMGYDISMWESLDAEGQRIRRIGLQENRYTPLYIFIEENTGSGWRTCGYPEAYLSVPPLTVNYEITCPDNTAVPYLFPGQSVTLELKNNEPSFPGEENVTTVWMVDGQTAPAANSQYTWTTDGRKITITAKDVIEHEELWISFRMMFDGYNIWPGDDDDNDSYGYYIDIYPDECDYDFQFADETRCLIDVGYVFKKNISYRIANKEYPNGKEGETQVQSLEVVSQLDENGKAASGIYEIEERAFDMGWYIRPRKFGSAVIRATYTTYDGKTATRDFKVTTIGEEYNFSSEDDNTAVVYGQTEVFSTRLHHIYMKPMENGNYDFQEEDVTNYTISVKPRYPDSDSITGWSFQVVDGNKIQVKAPDMETYRGSVELSVTISVNGKVVDDDAYFYVYADEAVYSIEPSRLNDGKVLDIPRGGELNLSALGVKAYKKTKDGKKETDELTFRLDYEASDWSVKPGTENNKIPTLIRNTPTYSSVRLRAGVMENGDWNEYASAYYDVGSLHYQLSYKYSYGSATTGVTLTKPLTLTLQANELAGVDYQVGWTVTYGIFENGKMKEEPVTDSTVYSISSDGRSITINKAGNTKATSLMVSTTVYYKESEIGYIGQWINLEKKPTMSLTASSLKMKKGQTTTALKVTGMQSWDFLKSVTTDKKGAKVIQISDVSKKGTFKLKAKTTGSATLTITLDSGMKKTVKVTVQSGTVKTTKIGGLKKSYSVQKGKKLTLKPTLTPITSQQKVTYSTSNKKVATVSSKGVVTARSAGTAKITVKSGSKSFVCTVKVTTPTCTKLTGVKSKLTLKVKKSATLKPKRVPSSSTNKITYTSSNKKVATVSSKGKITAKKKGTTTITVKCGKAKATCKVTVK